MGISTFSQGCSWHLWFVKINAGSVWNLHEPLMALWCMLGWLTDTVTVCCNTHTHTHVRTHTHKSNTHINFFSSGRCFCSVKPSMIKFITSIGQISMSQEYLVGKTVSSTEQEKFALETQVKHVCQVCWPHVWVWESYSLHKETTGCISPPGAESEFWPTRHNAKQRSCFFSEKNSTFAILKCRTYETWYDNCCWALQIPVGQHWAEEERNSLLCTWVILTLSVPREF